MQNYRVERWSQLHAPNSAMLRYILVSEGFRVFQWSDMPEAVYVNHKHDTDQSHRIVSGAMELTIERVGTVVINAGDRDFMPAGTYHSARVVSEEPVVYLVGEKIE